MEWREARHQQMQEPSSWLTIAGLFWLEEGESTFGTDSSTRIRLPEGSAPGFAGTFTRQDRTVRFVSAPGARITIGDESVEDRLLRSDAMGRADILELNDLRLWVIERDDRVAIRMRDYNAARFTGYTGLDFYPPTSEYRINAEFVAYDPPKTIIGSTIVGTRAEWTSPGYVRFRIGGEDYTLDAFGTGPGSNRLHFVFKDGTSGTETYGASRFMDALILQDGSVDLNFNRAYNPPCAYTPFATCPLPPPQNILTVRIEAGERNYPGATEH
jgi:uncharacterized protein (DUF1684 family)